jgi:hypothetical protein
MNSSVTRRHGRWAAVCVVHAMGEVGLYGNSKQYFLPRAERDDAPHRIVGGNSDRDAVSGHHFDAEPAHTAAQLGKDLVALVALDAVQTATVDRDYRTLHVD